MMQDAVELFLQLASEHLNVGENRVEFMKYWDLIKPKLAPEELQQKESMRRLNKARVALKHHGTFPSELDIQAFRGNIVSFFQDNTPFVFGITLDEVSLVEFVNPDSAREHLKEAHKRIQDGDTLSALDSVAYAFHEVIDDYEDRKRGRGHYSPFYFGRDLSSLTSFHMRLGGDEVLNSLGRFVDDVGESVRAMQRAMKILALGLDYRRYSRFIRFIPKTFRSAAGLGLARRRSEKNKPTSDEARFCVDFVIESALALAEFDYSVEVGETK